MTVVEIERLKGDTMSNECATCGEPIAGAAAEVVRDGEHVVVHADTCLREGEEVA